MSKDSCEAAESAVARLCEWRGLGCDGQDSEGRARQRGFANGAGWAVISIILSEEAWTV